MPFLCKLVPIPVSISPLSLECAFSSLQTLFFNYPLPRFLSFTILFLFFQVILPNS